FKVEANKLTIESTVFTVQDVMDATAALYQLKANEKGLKLRFTNCDETSREYVGDPTRIQQVLGNLVSNALKFTEDGAVLASVTARSLDGGRRTALRFTVADSGPGIEPEVAERLFSNFVQADSSVTRKHGGTGLGLAICKRLCALMGGDITLESIPGQGSVFRFHVVVDDHLEEAAPRPAAAMAGGAAPVEAGEAPRILVAEDNPQNQMVLEALLEPFEAEITMTANGREAVDAWKAGLFDVVLMDVQMPKMSGVEACLEIRRMERESGLDRTPILALTANAMSHQVQEYLEAGMEAHVAKPIKPHELFATLRAALAGDLSERPMAAAA
ncbi:MAG: ATP-binding protein, partial [Caulobacterales bacterium]|nr:ATP-binding protein [Caulobacterales bacterium]